MIEFNGLSGFQELLMEMKHFRNSTGDDRSAEIHEAQLQIKARHYIVSLPFHVLESVHPQIVVRRIREFPEEERTLLGSITACFLNHGAGFRDNQLLCDQVKTCDESGEALYRLISGWPLMPDHYKFTDAGWSQLPMMHWSRIEKIERVSEENGKVAKIAEFYRPAFSQLTDSEKSTSLEWLSFKMHPDRWVIFREKLLDTTWPGSPFIQRAAEKIWKKMVMEDLAQ